MFKSCPCDVSDVCDFFALADFNTRLSLPWFCPKHLLLFLMSLFSFSNRVVV